MHNTDHFIMCKMQRKQCSNLTSDGLYSIKSIKSRVKTIIRASDKVQEKL